MAKAFIREELPSEAIGDSLIKVICTAASPYGAEGQEIDFLDSLVEDAIAKGFIIKK